MKEDIKDIWVKALRSGEYKQTRNYLRQGDSFCCLGVLCDLAIKNGVDVTVNEGSHSRFYYYDGSHEGIPDSVVEWSGFSPRPSGIANEGQMLAPDGEYISFISRGSVIDKQEVCLSVLNDNYDLNFDQIADVIEKNWKLL